MDDANLAIPSFLRLVAVMRLTGLSKSKLYRLIKEEKFPRQRKIDRSARWLTSEVTHWIA